MIFNKYEKLDISVRPLFLEYCEEEWIAESGFTSYFMWNDVLDCHYTVMNEIFCILFHSEEEYYAALFSKKFTIESVQNTLIELKQLFEEENAVLKLAYVLPSLLRIIEMLDCYNYEVSYDRKYSDYIYETVQFTNIAGKSNQSRRYDLNYFQRHFQPEIEEITAENIEQCLEVIEKTTCTQKDCCDCGYGCEKDALKAVIPQYDTLGCKGIFVKTAGEIAAYVIGEPLSDRLFAYHFLKLDKSMRGLSVFLQKQFAERHHADVPYINYSEDLAYTGLKKYKLRMRPYCLAHKYFVTITSLVDEN